MCCIGIINMLLPYLHIIIITDILYKGVVKDNTHTHL